uniref:Uncharacterized protein n=1 Tax=Ciona savignyi TaxID=51511 RepID=H2Z1N8_CIOSA
MAYYPGQYGPYTTYNPQQQQGNYQQYGNYNPAQSTSHTTAPNTAYGITNNTSGAAVSQPSTQATDTPNYGYSYTNPATTTTNSSNPALHTISNLWYNQTTSAAQTAISQNSRTTQQQQVANYQAQMAQFYQHQANLVQQQQQQQQQQQMTAVQNMGGNQYKASPATKTESKISTAIPVSTTQQLNNWPYAAFMQMQQHHKPQDFPGFSKQTATKDESAGQNPSLSTTQQQSAYRSQPNTYQQPTNVKNGFVA